MMGGTVDIDAALVQRLVAAQFPAWSGLVARPVVEGGWDNRTFRLGEELVVRLPSAQVYAVQVERERRWLPHIASRVSLPIPVPLAVGEPQFGYPWRWSVHRWLDGDTALPERIGQLAVFARDLAAFLRSLHAIPADGGPTAGPDTFHRGGSLAVYDAEARWAITALASRLDPRATNADWQAALDSAWDRNPLWVHGDMAVGNLLVRDGRLCAVIDFGQFCVGDPACDLVPAWTLFDAHSRAIFRADVGLDAAAWARGRGWALWKALIGAARRGATNAWEGTRCWATIEAVLSDHARTEA
jgi:aminoglycoside phosphotransferase (APT) family kinase protein